MQCSNACPLYPNIDRKSGLPQTVMSALPSKADTCGALRNVGYGPKADICTAPADVCFTPKRDICERSNGRGARIVTEQPFIPGLHPLFLPLSVNISFRTRSIRKTLVVESFRIFCRTEHYLSGTLLTCGFIGRKCSRVIESIFL